MKRMYGLIVILVAFLTIAFFGENKQKEENNQKEDKKEEKSKTSFFGKKKKDKDTSGAYRPSERHEKRRIFSLFYSFSFQKVAVFSILG